jgi:hypothetical protein
MFYKPLRNPGVLCGIHAALLHVSLTAIQMLIEINFWSAGWTRDCPWRAWVLSEESSIGMETLQIMGKVYGVYSFLTGRVVDGKTGAPVENARVQIIGPALPETRKTNAGGWWNLAKDSQRNEKYLLLVAKRNYYPVMDSVDYAGEPLTKTIEINTW